MSDTPETDAFMTRIRGIDGDKHWVPVNTARRLERERDEARESLKHITEYGTEEINAAVELRQKLASALVERDEVQKAVNGLCEHFGVSPANTTLLAVEVLRIQRERDEAQKQLSSIHHWIDKNHADGFIDSLTYLQNLDRVTDNWYDRIDGIEADARKFVRERDEAIRARDVALKVAHTYDEAHTKACQGWAQAERERGEAREQNAKLRDIAERLFAAVVGRMKANDWRTFRAELDQLKEGAK